VRAERLADELGGAVVEGERGTFVRIDRPARRLGIDRARLADLPGHPGPTVPLVCLDTETTGLGTAAGTFAFLVGLGWAAAYVASTALLADHAETTHRGRAIGVSDSGAGAMTVLAAAVTGPLVECTSLPAAGAAAALVAAVPLLLLIQTQLTQLRHAA